MLSSSSVTSIVVTGSAARARPAGSASGHQGLTECWNPEAGPGEYGVVAGRETPIFRDANRLTGRMEERE